jgi:hypothetical protein
MSIGGERTGAASGGQSAIAIGNDVVFALAAGVGISMATGAPNPFERWRQ